MSDGFRKEKDVLGEINVPKDVYWGINTQRALNNFKISGKTFPDVFIIALAIIKKACIKANLKLGLLEKELANALLKAVDEIIVEKKYLDQFPIDIYQTGSGTQTNMNMNEVLANRANEILGYLKGKKEPVHPNDHVNMGQSSNDVIPSAMYLATYKIIKEELLPILRELNNILEKKIEQFNDIIKVGRTHLQDAVPIPLSLEFKAYRDHNQFVIEKLESSFPHLAKIPIGGTAVGTGLNAHKDLARLVCSNLKEYFGFSIEPSENKAQNISSHMILVDVSGTLRLIALNLLKMANDIRWMGSGPRAGLGELRLPSNEPGSSIMPGKVNPTQCEMLIQVSLKVLGNDSVVELAESHGSILDLNVCKPIMIYSILDSIYILINGVRSFTENCLKGLEVNKDNIKSQLDRMLMIVTNLNPIIGYDKASEVAQKAYKENKTIKEVILEMGIKIEGDLDDLLDPKKMV
ncbi:MAG: class II fumarate hydratase [Promethearchaeota archaeon]|nr:MAG: class II fumarate hydratase [Candidatus Lokiarchaeota archaeon]